MNKQQDKIIVTGGASGIGKAVTSKLLQDGGAVCVIDNDIQALKVLLEEYPDHDLITVEADVSSGSDIHKAIQYCIDKMGTPSKLVLSAGIHMSGDIETFSESDWDRLFDVNTKGVFLTIKYLYPYLITQRNISIVVVGSDQSSVAKPHNFAYGATKGAVMQMIKSLALDFAAFDIRINSVSPGPVDTPLLQRALKKLVTDDLSYNALVNLEVQAVAMKRLARDDEVAEAVLFLLSDASSFITGISLPVDGGLSAGVCKV